MISNYDAEKSIKRLAGEIATKESLAFELEYDMKDLSKGAFWPWNRAVRDQVARVAEENREKGIAEFIDGVEYEPNPIKRMMARVKQKKLGNGKEKEDNVEEKTSKASNVFKKRIKDEAQKSDYEQFIYDSVCTCRKLFFGIKRWYYCRERCWKFRWNHKKSKRSNKNRKNINNWTTKFNE